MGSPYVHTTPDKPVYLKGQATTPCGEQFAGKSHVTSYDNILGYISTTPAHLRPSPSTADPLSYSWVIMEVPEGAPLMQLDSVLSSTPQLYIPAGTLSALGTYTLRFSGARLALAFPFSQLPLQYLIIFPALSVEERHPRLAP